MARPKIDIWMPVFVGDYLRDTQNLTAEEHGVYFLLLMHYWQRRGEIGADIKRLSVVTRSTPETTKYILENFFSLTDGNYKNKRADIELEAAMSRSESARANINKRWNKNSTTTVDTPVIPSYNARNTVDYTDDDTESIRNGYSSPSPLPIQIQEEVHTYLEVGGVGEGENEEKKCVPKKSNPKPKDKESTHVLDGYEYRSAVRIEWDKLGDKVYIAPDPILFENVWRDISPCIKGIHSDDVIQAIKNFGIIVNGPSGKYWWTSRISIRNFFQKHVDKFLPANFQEQDFLSRDYSPSLEERLAEIHAEEAERETARNAV